MPKVLRENRRVQLVQTRTARMEDGQLVQQPLGVRHVQAGVARRHPEALHGQILEDDRPAGGRTHVNGVRHQFDGDRALREQFAQTRQHGAIHVQFLAEHVHLVEHVQRVAALERRLDDAVELTLLGGRLLCGYCMDVLQGCHISDRVSHSTHYILAGHERRPDPVHEARIVLALADGRFDGKRPDLHRFAQILAVRQLQKGLVQPRWQR